MRISLKLGLGMAILWFLIKLAAFYAGFSEQSNGILALVMIFFLILSISLGLYLEKKKDTEGSNLMRDVKNALTAGIPFSMLVAIFIYFYDVKIDYEATAHKIIEKEYAIDQMVDNPTQLEAFRKEHADSEVMSKEQIRKRLKEANQASASPKNTMIIYLALLILLSTLYSIIIAIIMRKFFFR
jgi:hypothetical protein